MNEILKTLHVNVFHIKTIELQNTFKLEKNKLVLSQELESDHPNIKEINVSLLEPYQRNLVVNTILDIIPISTKVYGRLGEGLTHTLTGVYVLLTAKDLNHDVFYNFGSAKGTLKEIVIQDQVGTFKESDYLIHIDITTDIENQDPRDLIYEVHSLSDKYIQNIREQLKTIDARFCDETHTFIERNNMQGKKVVLIKEVGGQGAMYDNLILPNEPCGVQGAITIIDLKNMPIFLSPNEYRDGAIRALT